jgi:hypothetical protein
MKMKWTKRLIDNLNILNILLAAAAVALFILLDYPLINSDIRIIRPKAKPAAVAGAEKAAPASSSAYLDYAVVAEKNLFHPDRKVPVEKKDIKLLARPEIVLYGTMIVGDKKLAYIEDKKAPYSTPGRGKRQVTIDEGGMISGFKLIEVHEDHIVLTRGDEKMLVRLNDGKIRTQGQTQMGAMPAPGVNQRVLLPERKAGASPAEIKPAAQPQAPARIQPPPPAKVQPPPGQGFPKTNIPHRRESAPVRRPVPLEYNQNQ